MMQLELFQAAINSLINLFDDVQWNVQLASKSLEKMDSLFTFSDGGLAPLALQVGMWQLNGIHNNIYVQEVKGCMLSIGN